MALTLFFDISLLGMESRLRRSVVKYFKENKPLVIIDVKEYVAFIRITKNIMNDITSMLYRYDPSFFDSLYYLIELLPTLRIHLFQLCFNVNKNTPMNYLCCYYCDKDHVVKFVKYHKRENIIADKFKCNSLMLIWARKGQSLWKDYTNV